MINKPNKNIKYKKTIKNYRFVSGIKRENFNRVVKDHFLLIYV
jgi:hypothetical protein